MGYLIGSRSPLNHSFTLMGVKELEFKSEVQHLRPECER
jgi:hypothetical protein